MNTRPMPDIHDETFTTLADFQPTRYDQRGVGSNEANADWLVVPVFYHPKTASLLEVSNWETFIKVLENTQVSETYIDSETNDPADCYEMLYFGHRATDYKLFVVRPDSAAHKAAEKFCAALADYPVADESDFCEREYAAQLEQIEDGLRSLTIEVNGAEVDTDTLTHEIWQYMSDTQTGSLESTGCDGGGGPDRSDCETALQELGYVYCDDDMTWRLASQCMDRSEVDGPISEDQS